MKVKCINVDPLGANEVAPPLELNKVYDVKEIIEDSKGHQHYDVGLVSKYNYIRSFDTGEDLERGDSIHWCHPSRFEVVVGETQND